MSNAVAISGSKYTVRGTVLDQANNQGIEDLHVIAYDQDPIGRDDYLGIGVTNPAGEFSVTFDKSDFKGLFDREPDLYFSVEDGGLELLNTKDDALKNADESTPPIKLLVSISDDKLRQEINKVPAAGWVGGFKPTSTPPLTGNHDNDKQLKRMQKVLWPEFSWLSDQEDQSSRCYQMFAPDISRLGYTDEGQVFSIICPQQGICSPSLGCLNVEVTVLTVGGWADEDTREVAAGMTIEPQIWFSPSAHANPIVKLLWHHFDKSGLQFPFDKANAFKLKAYKPGTNMQEIAFPVSTGKTTDFPIPAFTEHQEAWAVANLEVEIGPIRKVGDPVVDDFNQLVLDIFNLSAGNLLTFKNILAWNVWFTAPEVVVEKEWEHHTEKWRKSIDADHGSPDGPGSSQRYFDGSPFKPIEALVEEEIKKIHAYLKKHL